MKDDRSMEKIKRFLGATSYTTMFRNNSEWKAMATP